MKICILTNTRPHEGGMTSYINSFAKGLRKLNCEIEIVSFLGVSSYRETKSSLVKKTDSFLSKGNWKIVIIYRLSEIWLFFILFLNYLKKRYDLIYAVDDSAANVGTILQKIFTVPVIHSVHSSLIKDLLNQSKISEGTQAYHFFVKQQRRAYQNVNLLIANSTYTKNGIQNFAPNHALIEISRNVVDEEMLYSDKSIKDTVKKECDIPLDKFIILCAGRLAKRKGVVYLLLAFIELIKQGTNYHLIYAGDGPERKTLENLIVKHGIDKQVTLLGSIPYRKIGRVFNASDLAIVPSITHEGLEEPLGISALDAMATGVPVIVSNIGGLKEIVRDGYNGLVVPEKNVSELAQAIETLRNDPDKRKKLIQNGLQVIAERHTSTKVAQSQLDMCSKHILHFGNG